MPKSAPDPGIVQQRVTRQARILAERILRRVTGHKFGEPDRRVPVTVSIGVATYPDDRARRFMPPFRTDQEVVARTEVAREPPLDRKWVAL